MGDNQQDPAGGITAYHGSPHDFDKFDMSKTGTGEGEQAYGHGLYFAENEGVAKSYRDALAPKTYLDDALKSGAFSDNPALRAASSVHFAKGEDAAIARLRPQAEAGHVRSQEALDAILDGSYKEFTVPKGSMYEVHINAHPDHFLDWDKPLSEQSAVVRAAVNRAGRKPEPYGLDRVADDMRPVEMKNLLNTPDGIAALNQHGVPGIKYLDAGSRGKDGNPTHNYVVFDDKLVHVRRKYNNGGRVGYDDGGSPSGGLAKSVAGGGSGASAAAAPADVSVATGQASTSSPSINDQVNQAYQDVLGRTADEGGLKYYADQISGGGNIGDVYNTLLNSDEFNSSLKTAGYNGEGVTASTPVDTGPNVASITSNDQQGPKPAYLADFNYSDYADPLSARYAYLSQSLNPTMAAALMGNWQIESGNNPTQMQTVGGLDSAPRNLTSSGLPMGFGSAQWGGTRLQNDSGPANKMGLLDFSKKYGYDPNSTEGQDRFSVYELTTNPEYAKTYAAAQKAGDNLDSVTRILGSGWEAPKNLSSTLGDRQSSADMYFNKYGPGGNFDPADQTEINQTLARIQDPAFNKQYAGPTIQEYMAAAQNNIGNNGPAVATADATPTDTGSLIQPASVVDGNTILGNGTTDTVNGTANAGLNANPVLGNNGLMTDNTPIQTNSTGITGTNIIPWNQGLDPTLGSSSNGIPFGFGISGIDTGANPLGDYNIGADGGLGLGGFTFSSFNPDGFKHGGLVNHALRVARSAGGLAGQNPPMYGDRAVDRMNRILATRPKSGDFEDQQSNKIEYLQQAPGPQIRDFSFANGGGTMPNYGLSDAVQRAILLAKQRPGRR